MSGLDLTADTDPATEERGPSGFLLEWHCVGQRPKRPQVDPLRVGLDRSDLSNFPAA
jgi:hypothetical protein